MFRRKKPLKALKDELKEHKVVNQRKVGVKAIEIDKIVGSVDRAEDFDEQFRWLRRRPDDRTKRIERAIERGEILPPIEVYEFNNKYFVVDGHHRVAAAKKYGQDFVDADIIRLMPA